MIVSYGLVDAKARHGISESSIVYINKIPKDQQKINEISASHKNYNGPNIQDWFSFKIGFTS
jgi:hypothetical protein